jgi:F0F1-type ATP synthase membrane subunit c/vacuolar-type H+-ATPase subunit K
MDGSVAIGIGLGLGLAALGTGIGEGLAVNGATQGIARNPDANGKIFTSMIIGLALIESLLILCFVVMSGLTSKVPTPDQQKTSAVERPASHAYAMTSANRHTLVIK